jgi:hypothetical protein
LKETEKVKFPGKLFSSEKKTGCMPDLSIKGKSTKTAMVENG